MMFLHDKNIRFYHFSLHPTKQIVAFKGTKKNDVTRQAKFVGDSYSSKTTPKTMLAFKGTKNDVTRQAKFVGDSYSSKTTPEQMLAFKGTKKTM